jgi:hypothetical protein
MRLAVYHRSAVNNSSVSFHIALKTNTYFSFLMFLVVVWINYISKVRNGLDEVNRAWYGSVVVLWTIMEAPRLLLGSRGNLQGNVASLVGFLMLTFLGFFPIMIVYNVIIPEGNSVDYAISVVQLMLGVAEVVLCLRMIRRTVRESTYNFFVFLGARIEA